MHARVKKQYMQAHNANYRQMVNNQTWQDINITEQNIDKTNITKKHNKTKINIIMLTLMFKIQHFLLTAYCMHYCPVNQLWSRITRTQQYQTEMYFGYWTIVTVFSIKWYSKLFQISSDLNIILINRKFFPLSFVCLIVFICIFYLLTLS